MNILSYEDRSNQCDYINKFLPLFHQFVLTDNNVAELLKELLNQFLRERPKQIQTEEIASKFDSNSEQIVELVAALNDYYLDYPEDGFAFIERVRDALRRHLQPSLSKINEPVLGPEWDWPEIERYRFPMDDGSPAPFTDLFHSEA